MERIRILLYFAALLPICAGWVSCAAEHGPPDEETETIEQGFLVGTRTDLNGSPEHGDAYTLISYNVGGTSSNDAFINQIPNIRQCGYYAYDDGTDSGRATGTLVPVAISTPSESNSASVNLPPPFHSPPYYIPSKAPLTIDRSQSQRLESAPATGLNPTSNQGLYRTAIIYPAIPMHSSGTAGLGHLAVYHIDTDIWASDPDDADGDPDTEDPFEILVNANSTIHPLPERTELFPVKSAVKVSFYSEYFADSDTGMTSPRSQSFTITSLKLVNVGSNGWLNARTGIVYPNYNYGTSPTSGLTAGSNWRSTYSSSEIGVNADGTPLYPARGAYNFTDLLDPNHDGNGDDTLVVDESGNFILPPPRPGFPAPEKFIQWSAETPVFPSDYRGAENGGLPQVQPMSLRLELNVGGAPLKANVPIALLMERGKRYNFYVNVTSESIYIAYTVSEWGSGGGESDIGGFTHDYLKIDIEYHPGGWIVVGGGTDNIGD